MKCYACGREINQDTGKCPYCGFTVVRMSGNPDEYDDMMKKTAEEYNRSTRKNHMALEKRVADLEEQNRILHDTVKELIRRVDEQTRREDKIREGYLRDAEKRNKRRKRTGILTALLLLIAVVGGTAVYRWNSRSVTDDRTEENGNQESGSQESEENRTAKYSTGTYISSAQGMNSDVIVTMIFDGDSITDVDVDVSEETPGIGGSIGPEMVKRIMKAQSAQVDGVSGATITSAAVKTAAERCIALAMGKE